MQKKARKMDRPYNPALQILHFLKIACQFNVPLMQKKARKMGRSYNPALYKDIR